MLEDCREGRYHAETELHKCIGAANDRPRHRDHPKKRKKAMVAARKIKPIAGRLVRDIKRGLDDKDKLDLYDERLWLFLQRFVSGER